MTDQPSADEVVAGARTLANAVPPHRISLLPVDRHGYPIPWFVAELPDGSRDFRIADAAKRAAAHNGQLCWICGRQLGSYLAFVVGPMCAVNRISSEPPSHRDCADYAARCCPFLATPVMRRRELRQPDADLVDPPGVFLKRNPGATLVWITRAYRLDRVPGGGVLFQMGDPTELRWYREGRAATRAEVQDAMDSGLPALEQACDQDDDPAAARAELGRQYRRALRLLPPAEPRRR